MRRVVYIVVTVIFVVGAFVYIVGSVGANVKIEISY